MPANFTFRTGIPINNDWFDLPTNPEATTGGILGLFDVSKNEEEPVPTVTLAPTSADPLKADPLKADPLFENLVLTDKGMINLPAAAEAIAKGVSSPAPPNASSAPVASAPVIPRSTGPGESGGKNLAKTNDGTGNPQPVGYHIPDADAASDPFSLLSGRTDWSMLGKAIGKGGTSQSKPASQPFAETSKVIASLTNTAIQESKHNYASTRAAIDEALRFFDPGKHLGA